MAGLGQVEVASAFSGMNAFKRNRNSQFAFLALIDSCTRSSTLEEEVQLDGIRMFDEAASVVQQPPVDMHSHENNQIRKFQFIKTKLGYVLVPVF